MVQNKKKLPVWLAILGAALSGYAGYLLNGAWKPGQDLNAFLESFNQVCAEQFAVYYNNTVGVRCCTSGLYYQWEKFYAGERVWYSRVCITKGG